MLDIDGTLAPIVRRPGEAAVPEDARRELERLVARYALVACVSGRTGEDAQTARRRGRRALRGLAGLELRTRRTAGATRSTGSRRPWTGPSRTRA